MSTAIDPIRFACRRRTEANWIALNEVLLNSEIGVVTDKGHPRPFKIGDGSTAWNSLPYQTPLFAAGSGTNTITASFPVAPVLFDGLEVAVRAAGANTGAATFNPNSLGALAITKIGGVALLGGEIAGAGHELLLVYRASVPRWELRNPSTVLDQAGTQGDIIYRSATGWEHLPIGTAGDVFTSAGPGSNPGWAAPAGGGGGGSSYPSAVAFDPSKLGTGLVLSSSDTVVDKTSNNGAWSNVIALDSAQRWDGWQYIEFGLTAGSASMMFGLASLNDSLANYLGNSTNGVGYYAANGDKYRNGTNVAWGASLSPGDRGMIYYVPALGLVWFGKNGTWQGSGADPSRLLNPAYTGVMAGLVPTVALYNTSSTWAMYAKASNQLYSPPTRGTPWDTN